MATTTSSSLVLEMKKWKEGCFVAFVHASMRLNIEGEMKIVWKTSSIKLKLDVKDERVREYVLNILCDGKTSFSIAKECVFLCLELYLYIISASLDIYDTPWYRKLIDFHGNLLKNVHIIDFFFENWLKFSRNENLQISIPYTHVKS